MVLTSLITFIITTFFSKIQESELDKTPDKTTAAPKRTNSKLGIDYSSGNRSERLSNRLVRQDETKSIGEKSPQIETLAGALELDIDIKKDAIFNIASAKAERKRESITDEYAKLFVDEYGLAPENADFIAQAAYEIEKSKIEAQYLLDNLEYQKSDFDRFVQASLPEKDYESYRSYELNKQNEQYSSEFDAFSNRSEYSHLSEVEKKDLRNLLIQSQGNIITNSSSGPYGVPPSVLGAIYEPNSPAQKFYIEDQISLLSGERDNLKQLANSSEHINLINDFYNEKINEVLSLRENDEIPSE